jgi:hypothetical protein
VAGNSDRGSGVKYVSAQSLKRSVEQFGAWLHASGARLGNLRGERRWTAAVLHPGVVETVVRTTKAAKQSHSAAASVWVMLRGPGCGRGEEGRSGRTLTHLTTDGSAGAMGHAMAGGRSGFEVGSVSLRFGRLLRSMGSKQSREGWSYGGRSVAQVCRFHSWERG